VIYNTKNPLIHFMDISVYPVGVVLCIGMQGKDIAKVIKRRTGLSLSQKAIDMLTKVDFSDYFGRVVPVIDDHGALILVVTLESFEWTTMNMGYIAHEFLHVTFAIMDLAGIPYVKGGSNEAFAYLHDALTTQIFGVLMPKPRKKK